MGGKSTYLRQAALIAILAQMGSFVPAESANLPLIDRVFTRIGASDNLSRGRSTFLVEMTETAVILNAATPRSFIVLDEIGRGTATYDGLALAWAVVEHVHAKTRAKTLFATHYHELTELAEQLDGVRNLKVSVKEAGDHIIFLRRVEPGRADRSYGIEVARLAGLPLTVISRAREVLKLHERTEHVVTEELAKSEDTGPVQIQLFEPVGYGIAERIRGLNLDELRPIEALQLLSRIAEGAEAAMRVAGVMSGTSLDGIDVAIVEIARPPSRPIGFQSTPYSAATRAAILAVSDAATETAAISRLNFQLGELYARAVLRAVRRFGPVKLVGCHGQTIYHEGASEYPADRRGGGDRGAHRRPRSVELSRARYRRRGSGRAAGAVRRLPALPPSETHAHRAQYRRHRQLHRDPGGRAAGKGGGIRYRPGQHGDRRAGPRVGTALRSRRKNRRNAAA
jgi:hypothetical protein